MPSEYVIAQSSIDSAQQPPATGSVQGQANGAAGDWIACPSCDALHQVVPLKHGGRACCSRCGTELYREVDDSLDKVTAYATSALGFFLLANLFPFLSMRMGGRSEENILLSASLALSEQGYWELGGLVLLTSVLFPLLVICGTLYAVLPLRFGVRWPGYAWVYRSVKHLLPWTLVGVFMLGVLISIVKLMDLATVIPGPSLFFLAALLVAMVALNANLDERLVWGQWLQDFSPQHDNPSALSHAMLSCHSCKLLISAEQVDDHCPRCGGRLHARKTNSIARTWALLITAAVLYIPANLLPIMTVTQLGRGEPDTILSGVVHLIKAGMWGLALLVFFASIMVPVIKLLVLSYLLVSVQLTSCWRPRDRTLLFRVTEVVGAWSMLDIFLIGILVSLVKLDAFATVEAGPGASFFAAVVVLTMLAAHSFDPRLIWDRCHNHNMQTNG